MIAFQPLWDMLSKRKIPKSYLKTKGIVIGQSYTNLIHGMSISSNSVDSICEWLKCQPNDIMMWIPNQTDKE